MATQTNLHLLTKLEVLERYTRIALMQFPKYEKFLLSGEIRQELLDIKRLIIRAAKKYAKKTTLTDLDIEIEVLRSDIRVAYRLGYIDEHKLGVWMEQVDEIGRMVGGWIRKQ